MKACLTCLAGSKLWLVVASKLGLRGTLAHSSLQVRHFKASHISDLLPLVIIQWHTSDTRDGRSKWHSGYATGMIEHGQENKREIPS
ncbi:hypothetical protein CTAM01_11910 [Colletotrichum tamarilloi]|uniref:Secreted protein n=1 Tax=Colletotrichum tamarilloi TaxID=1209934 RepID=A0ABQ9QWB2_9PEZI|nr:uncharacterized protein CTAM01_11910 [Colletotrichum tamarilloi]KAK1487139.1 hypothetical protein CTAM01_11910 [Colletotrichum tamarilloi]